MLSRYKIRPLHGADYPPKDKRGGRIGVYLVENGKEEFLGEYERNYSSLFNTFFPFHLNGKDLALYSADYTATRIMELPSCRDLGGEERDEMGFCPVDYFIPTYIDQMRTESTYRPLTPVLYYPFGFVAGCIWGNDRSYKVQYLDLSRADKGILKREERFGYIELPEDLSLKDAIDMEGYGDDLGDGEVDTEIRIKIAQRFDLLTGERTEG